MSGISFAGQVVIVTGAGGGIGRGYALDIAGRGGAVVVNDLGCDAGGSNASPHRADSVVAEIIAAGGRAVASYDSVETTAGAKNIIAAGLSAFGRVDALINNAGNMRNAWFESSREEDLDALLSVHLKGAYNVSKAAWPLMKAQGYGRIVFTVSSAGLFGNRLQSGYGAAKAGVLGLMNALALEGEPHGILCNAVMPNATGRMAGKMAENSDRHVSPEGAPVLSASSQSPVPDFNTGLAVYLSSKSCSSSHGLYSTCGGRVARVFVGVTEGWQGARELPVSAEEVAANFAQICELKRGVHVPTSPIDEFRIVAMGAEPLVGGALE